MWKIAHKPTIVIETEVFRNNIIPINIKWYMACHPLNDNFWSQVGWFDNDIHRWCSLKIYPFLHVLAIIRFSWQSWRIWVNKPLPTRQLQQNYNAYFKEYTTWRNTHTDRWIHMYPNVNFMQAMQKKPFISTQIIVNDQPQDKIIFIATLDD